MDKAVTNEMLSFIQNSPTAFHAIDNIRLQLRNNGFEELHENQGYYLTTGKKYYVCRNDSSIIAFKLGDNLKDYVFNIAASHSDSPTFKIKEKPELVKGKNYTVINTEGYGGMILTSWFDRPLKVAGRVVIKEESGVIKPVLYNSKKPLMLIPNVAIHLSRDGKDDKALNKQVDLLPIFSTDKSENILIKYIARDMDVEECQIIGHDLYLCSGDNPSIWGCNEEFVSSPRLDDLQCAFASLKAFLDADNKNAINVFACFDNEEVGSLTKQGAASTFLADTLIRINSAIGKNQEDYLRAVADSFMLSADNAHAVHPNHPELTDESNCVYMNEGIVVKSHAGQKYTSDGLSIAIVKELAGRAGVPLQFFANRSDKVGGSTLGNLVMSQVSLKCADIGIAQLAMHSVYETAGTKDTLHMINLMKELYESRVTQTADGSIIIEKDK